MRVVAVLNQKGGVGKTTTAVNLGAALALRENEVLLIDLDPQGNLTDHLGLDPGTLEGEADRPSAYDVLMGEAALRDAVLPTGTPHLAVLPSHQDLAAVELELAGVPGRELRLKEALAKLPPKAYDWVLIDCPPSLGLLSLNAMAAANEVFITLQTEYFALRGLGQLDKIVSLVREQVNPRLVISGIVATLVDPVTNLAREVVEEVKSVYGHRVFATRIRKNVRLAEAPGHQSHIFAYAPTSTGAADYHALADEVEAWDPTAGAPSPAVARKPAVPVAIPVEEPTRRQNGPKEKAAAAAKPPHAPSGAAAPRPKEAPKAQPPAPTKEATKAPVQEAGKPAPRATTPVATTPVAAAKAPAAAPTPPRTAGGTFAPRNPTPPAKSAEPAAKPSAPPRSPPAPTPPAPKPAAPAAKPVASATSAVSPPTHPTAPVPSGKPSAKGPGSEVRTPAVPEPKPTERKQAEARAAEPKEPAPKAAEVKAGAAKAAAPVPAAPAKSAPAAPARPAVPSPALRNPRPWMKPAGK